MWNTEIGLNLHRYSTTNNYLICHQKFFVWLQETNETPFILMGVFSTICIQILPKGHPFFRNKLIIDRLCLLHKFNSWQFSQELYYMKNLISDCSMIWFNIDNPLYSGLALVLSIRYALVASAARRVIAHSYAVLGYSSHKHLHYLHNTLG